MTPTVFFRWVAWLLLFASAVFTLSPIEFRPVTEAPVSLERFAAFAVIGAAFCFGYPKYRLHVLLLLIGIVGFLEVVQNYVPGRHGRLPDGLVKASGALLGAAFAAFIARYGSLLRETRKGKEL
jgi:VanZ family protein